MGGRGSVAARRDVLLTFVTTVPASAPLVVRTVEIPEPGPLLHLLPATAPLAWVRSGEGVVGWGEAAHFETRGPSRFADADRWWRAVVAGAVVRDEVGLPGSGPIAFGSFGFADEPGTSTLVLPEVVAGHRDGRWWVTTVGLDGRLPPVASLPTPQASRRGGRVRFSDGSRSGVQWTGIVAEAVRRINAGGLEKIVLARDIVAESTHPVDLRQPLRRLADQYPRCWTFSVDGIIGATPELLVRRERGLVTSRVLAGTIRRTGDDARDLRWPRPWHAPARTSRSTSTQCVRWPTRWRPTARARTCPRRPSSSTCAT